MDKIQLNQFIAIWVVIAICVFTILMFINAPYGRYIRSGWGINIPARISWITMESPAIIVMSLYFFNYLFNHGHFDVVGMIFYVFWMFHYIHRTLIWPFRAQIRKKEMPISIALFAMCFNIINSVINAESIFKIHFPYPENWIISPQFILGILIFALGMLINITSDNILLKLRKESQNEYVIPAGGLFGWVSSPNYFGEILEWIGWAIATWSLAGFSFAIWVIANLAPRARSNHLWYIENFDNYPKNRKILIPGLW